MNRRTIGTTVTWCVAWLAVLMLSSIAMAEVKVKDIAVKPRWPWNGLVDITYSIECDETDDEGKPKSVYVEFAAIDTDRNREIVMRTLTGDGATDAVKDGGPYTVTWDADKDSPKLHSAGLQVKIHAITGIPFYLVVNLQTWKRRYSLRPPNLDDDICRTTELWLRRIPAGTFLMGSPVDELGSNQRWEGLHTVTLTQWFYMGVFECTQKQWELVMGDNPSKNRGACRPVDFVYFSHIRGNTDTAGAGWPKYGHAVDDSSFMGRLRAKTGLMFDLPTQAQWEYACRAGTTTALNSGKNLTNGTNDDAMDEVGRYYYNQSDGKGGYTKGHTKVGSYLPNAWGLYDMHGNVEECCLDWYDAYPYYSNTTVYTDPVGPGGPDWMGTRIMRGGSYAVGASGCRSAGHSSSPPTGTNSNHGFRVICLP